MTDPNDGELHVWSDEEGDYLIARTRDDLAVMLGPDDAELGAFVALPDDYNLALQVGGEDDDDGLSEAVTKTCSDWIASEGAGRLGSGKHYGES